MTKMAKKAGVHTPAKRSTTDFPFPSGPKQPLAKGLFNGGSFNHKAPKAVQHARDVAMSATPGSRKNGAPHTNR